MESCTDHEQRLALSFFPSKQILAPSVDYIEGLIKMYVIGRTTDQNNIMYIEWMDFASLDSTVAL